MEVRHQPNKQKQNEGDIMDETKSSLSKSVMVDSQPTMSWESIAYTSLTPTNIHQSKSK